MLVSAIAALFVKQPLTMIVNIFDMMFYKCVIEMTIAEFATAFFQLFFLFFLECEAFYLF